MGDEVSLNVLNTKLDAVLARLDEIAERQEDVERRLRVVEVESARHAERLSLVAGGLAVLQLVGSAIAAAVGVLAK